jgi:hypothetical protein
MDVPRVVYFGTLASAALIPIVMLLRQIFRGEFVQFGPSGVRHNEPPPAGIGAAGVRGSAPRRSVLSHDGTSALMIAAGKDAP